MDPTVAHCTAANPIPTIAKPTMAPTMVWVVETGQPKYDATINQTPAASNDASMPNTSSSGLPASRSASMMPLRMVAVTWPPASTAPRNSNIAAMTTAWRRLNAREPTDVPMALATSLAPIPQAMNRPKTAASIR